MKKEMFDRLKELVETASLLNPNLIDEEAFKKEVCEILDIKTNKPVCQLSQKIMSELSTWNEKNYFVSDVSIRFIVAWRPKDAPKEEKEHAVLLADLTLNKYVSE